MRPRPSQCGIRALARERRGRTSGLAMAPGLDMFDSDAGRFPYWSSVVLSIIFFTVGLLEANR